MENQDWKLGLREEDIADFIRQYIEERDVKIKK